MLQRGLASTPQTAPKVSSPHTLDSIVSVTTYGKKIINDEFQYLVKMSSVNNNNVCIVSNFAFVTSKNRVIAAPPTLYDTGCSVFSGLILSSKFVSKSKIPIFSRPRGQVLYNVRAADKSVMPIAGYVHELYLRLDEQDFLFEDIPVFDTLSFEAIIGLAARNRYALNFCNKSNGEYELFIDHDLKKRQNKVGTTRPSVPSKKIAALTPKVVLSPRGGEGSKPPWTEGCQAPKLAPSLPSSSTIVRQKLGAEEKKADFEIFEKNRSLKKK